MRSSRGSFAGSDNTGLDKRVANVAKVPLSAAPALSKTRHEQPCVLMVGPEQMTVFEMRALKDAFEALGAKASIFRADTWFGSGEFEDAARKCTHFILGVAKEPSVHEHRILDLVLRKVEVFSIICFGSNEGLTRFTELAAKGKIKMLVSRTSMDNALSTHVLGSRVYHSMMCEDLVKSAKDIAEAVLPAALRAYLPPV